MIIERGLCSWFGGSEDDGMAEDEGLAFIYEVSEQPVIFMDGATQALGRNLDPETFYIAMRWDYDDYPREHLLKHVALVRNPINGLSFTAIPADWGPHEDTGRVADISPGLMFALGVETDDEVEVVYPWPEFAIREASTGGNDG